MCSIILYRIEVENLVFKWNNLIGGCLIDVVIYQGRVIVKRISVCFTTLLIQFNVGGYNFQGPNQALREI